jgi:hypothetical protein
MDQDLAQAQPSGAEPGEVKSWVWSADGASLRVSIDFEVVDRLGFEVMRGYGAVPRRGAEVGGILLGRVDEVDSVAYVEDFVLVPSEHLKGPSYILSERDFSNFDEIKSEWGPVPGRPVHAIGFFRSNTRETLQLTIEDIELLDDHFLEPTAICLLIRPYATKPPEAAFFIRRDGSFTTVPPEKVFPFRRKDLGGGSGKKRRNAEADNPLSLVQAAVVSAQGRLQSEGTAPAAAPSFGGLATPPSQAEQAPSAPVPSRSKLKGGWLWIPLSFIFLLLGIVLGFQVALSFREPPSVQTSLEYAIGLEVAPLNENLHLKWNAESAVVRRARRGILHISDGDNQKSFSLTREDLSRGGVLYRQTTQNVQFRLEVFLTEDVSVTETLVFRLLNAPQPSEQSTGAPKDGDERKAR